MIGLNTKRGVSKKRFMQSCNELDFVIFGRLIKVNARNGGDELSLKVIASSYE